MPAPIAVPLAIAGASQLGSYLGQRSTNKQNLKIAREQMSFQERMSNTSYQRAIKDMSAAGINPMLAYMKGGASSPGGASAQMQNPLSGLSSSAIQAARLTAELKQVQAQTKANAEQARKTGAEADYAEAKNNAYRIVRGADGSFKIDFTMPGMQTLVDAELSQAQSSARAAKLQIPGLENVAEIEGSDAGQSMKWIRYILQSLGKAR